MLELLGSNYDDKKIMSMLPQLYKKLVREGLIDDKQFSYERFVKTFLTAIELRDATNARGQA
jgi:hypothetical protein